MINFADSIKFLFPYLFIILGAACMIWALRHLRKSRVARHSGYIFNNAPEPKMSFRERIKASWMIGWNMGTAYGMKKRQEREARKNVPNK